MAGVNSMCLPKKKKKKQKYLVQDEVKWAYEVRKTKYMMKTYIHYS